MHLNEFKRVYLKLMAKAKLDKKGIGSNKQDLWDVEKLFNVNSNKIKTKAQKEYNKAKTRAQKQAEFISEQMDNEI
jgi:hypothetical protein